MFILDEQWEERQRKEYGELFDQISFLHSDDVEKFTRQREQLLHALTPYIRFYNNRTKLVYGEFSPGCKSCSEGKWSCLFISNRCNLKCFFCPTRQNEEGIPGTNTLLFPEPAQYTDYLAQFDFTGVSISGGEPLLLFDKTLRYIEAVKRQFGDTRWIWLYTNGSLLTEEKARILASTGVQEIRFDLAALNYHTKPLEIATKYIPVVTIEIPAIPEDFVILTSQAHVWSEIGVRYLNLHQLRLTPFNAGKLLHRPYTFLPGEKITVLESELTALQFMLYAAQNSLPLGINYCSFIYKNHFQKIAARRRAATLMLKPGEEITGNGMIRRIQDPAEPGNDMALSVQEVKNRLKNRKDFLIRVQYFSARLRENASYRYPFHKITLPSGKTFVAERALIRESTPVPAFRFIEMVEGRNRQTDLFLELTSFEFPPEGFPLYIPFDRSPSKKAG